MTAIKLKRRILLPLATAGLALFGFLSYSIYRGENDNIDEEFLVDTSTMEAVYAAATRDHAAKMHMALNFIADNPELKAAFRSANRQQLLELSAPLFERLQYDFQITHFYFHDAKRVNFLRVHQPPRFGDTIDRVTALKAEESGMLTYGAELGPLGTFTLRVVMPWYERGELLGYLELGEEIERLMSELSASFHMEMVLLMDKEYLERGSWESGMRMLKRDANWDRLPDAVVPYQTLPAGAGIQLAQLPAATAGLFDLHTSNRRYRSGYIPLRDAGNRMVGRILMMRDVSPRVARLDETMRHSAIAATVVGALLFGLFFVILGRTERQMSAWRQQLLEEEQARDRIQEQHIRALEQLALYDSMTELPNRKLLHDRIDHAIEQTRHNNEPFALLLLDVQRLREINDTLGHDSGDAVIRQVAQRLDSGMGAGNTVARPGGGEFAVLMPAANGDQALSAAKQVQWLLSEPFDVQEVSVDIGAAVGIALYPEHGGDADTLLRHADMAMRHAKGSVKGYAVYEREADTYNPRRLALFGDLRKAIGNEGLQLHYQPQVNLATQRVDTVEALARWQHPTLGNISPVEFVPLAEHTGMIRSFTAWVLDAALRQSREWLERGIDIKVSVNLSTRNLLDSALPEQITVLLEKWRVDSSRLQLEITESAFMHEHDNAMHVLLQLEAMGIALIIDDFGTGYSSLSYLKHLPVVELKIDKSFVFDMLHDQGDAQIVASTIGLAHNLGLRVVAEGVESQAVMDALVAQGCDLVQGYFVSRPLPAAALEAWLDNAPWPVPARTTTAPQ